MEERIKRYREHPGINQSYLKTFLNPYKKARDSSSFHKFTKGNLLDVLVTMEESFEDYFYISQMTSKPSDAIMEIIDYIHDNFNAPEGELTPLLDITDFILEAADKFFYGWKKDKSKRQWTKPVLINKVAIQGQEYWFELLQAGGREVVTPDEVELAKTLKNTLYTHPLTTELFKQDLEFQKDIYFDLAFDDELKIEGKGLLDICHVTDTTARVIDIKATDVSPWEVEMIIKKFRYDIQVAFYSEGLKKVYPNKTILPPRIIFCHNNFPETISIVELSTEDYEIALIGSKYNTINLKEGCLQVLRKTPILGIRDAIKVMLFGQHQERVKGSNLW